MALRDQVHKWAAGVTRFGPSRLLRRIGIAVAVILVFFGLAGFLGVPLILRQIVLPKLADALHRPVRAQKIRFNPYVLRLRIEKLHIGDRDSSQPFLDLRRVNIKASWASLFRLAPVIADVAIDGPVLHIVRVAENRFNFSDLTQSTQPSSPTSKPFRFSVSNIQLHDGDVRFEDKVTGQQHRLERIRLDIPFIANLPADVSIYVQPLLEMIIDGSRLRISGKAKPFAVPSESVMDLKLHRFELAPFLGYLPVKLPIKMPGGTLSSALELHFVNSPTRPVIRVSGAVALDQIDLRDAANGPLVGIHHAVVGLNDLEPLERVAHLSKVHINGLALNIIRSHDGTTNFTFMQSRGTLQTRPTGGTTPQRTVQPSNSPPPEAQANQVQTTAGGPARKTSSNAAAQPPALDFSLDSFELINGKVDIADDTGVKSAKLVLQEIQIGTKDLHTLNQPESAPFEITTQLGGGGSVSLKGAIDLAQSQVVTDVTVDQVSLPALQDFAQSILAGQIAAGTFGAHAKVQAQFASNHFNLHVGPADGSVENFDIRSPREQQDPVKWERLSLTLSEADLASRRATVKEIRSEGLSLFMRREHDGKLSLASLLAPPASPAPETAAESAEGRGGGQIPHAGLQKNERSAPVRTGDTASVARKNSWQYRIESAVIERAEIRGEDEAAPHRVSVALTGFNVHLHNISSNLAEQAEIDTDGVINRKGNFKISGTVAPMPLKANLHVLTRGIDCAIADPYVSKQLNTTLERALLSMNGAVAVDQEQRTLRLSYRGDAELGKVVILDRVTRGPLLRWRRFGANAINFEMGAGQPKIHVGTLALSDFYASILLDKDGHLNLRDITAGGQSPPSSQPQGEASERLLNPMSSSRPTPSAFEAGANAAATGASTPTAPHPISADIEVRRITLQGGNIRYADNFIRPNYSANLTDISGKIGAFGTRSTAPAEVALMGQINGNSPINIDGSINPLVPMAFLDIKAKANGIELTELTPYSTKYTGYPIIKGSLTVDVHYLLDQQKLTAENHIFIDQLTFGDKVENSTATNLPIRLAVSLLKDARGQIDVRVPVSGSLNDPHFSLGGVILHALGDLIVKAATAPFSLLASAIGTGSGGSGEDYSQIVFAPGLATVTPQNKTKLDSLAKALKDRPALKLNIVGRVDPRFDVSGLREAMLTKAVRAQKIKDAGGDESDGSTEDQVSAGQYNKYLTRAYKAADFSKPRNAIGLTKSLPPDQMKRLMIEHINVTNDDLRKLAVSRADAVQKALAAEVEPSRLAVLAPKLNADGIKDQSQTTRVDLSFQ